MSDKSDHISRRKFLARSAGCIAAAGLTGAVPIDSYANDEEQKSTNAEKKLITRKLGRTDIVLPIISAGAGSSTEPSFYQFCYETGMRLFDTDARYRNGAHERLLGNVFSRMGIRDEIYILTKVHPPEQREWLTDRKSQEKLLKTFEGSLKRLKTDYVDILMIQDVYDRRTVFDQALLKVMTQIKKQGGARYIGIATHTNMGEVVNAMAELGDYDVVLTSVNFTMNDDKALMTGIAKAAKAGIGVIAMKTQAGGYDFPNPKTLKDFSNAVINSAALKWACRNENIVTAIPGFSNFDHIRENFKVAYDVEYTEQEKKFLSDNRIKLSMEFCRQCRKCLASCTNDVNIPALMRTHMYARQHGNMYLARHTLNNIKSGQGLDICRDCRECTARCANSVNISRKIDDLKLIYA